MKNKLHWIERFCYAFPIAGYIIITIGLILMIPYIALKKDVSNEN